MTDIDERIRLAYADQRGAIPPPPRVPLINVRRAELLSALVEGDLCELRLMYRNAPMRVRIDRKTARALVRDLAKFAEGGP